MPWLRIDDRAMNHPKIAGLPDGAFRLWVEGLAYCQSFLTDGAIPTSAYKGIRAYSPKRRDALIAAGLWIPADDGVTVHDYLQWNDSRAQVEEARAKARERINKLRGKGKARKDDQDLPACNAVQTANERRTNGERTPFVLGGRGTDPPQDLELARKGKRGVGEKPDDTDGANSQILFRSKRFVVFRWMYERLAEMLGPHLNDFHIDEWFFELSRQVDERGLVVPKDTWKWLQGQTEAEARRRGLPMASTPSVPMRTAANMAALERFKARRGVL